jgi:hypothetical protein
LEFFLKILNLALTVIAWLIVLAVVYAIAPFIGKFLHLIQSVHNFPN